MAAALAVPDLEGTDTFRQGAWGALRGALRSGRLATGLGVVGFFILVAVFGPLFVNAHDLSATNRLTEINLRPSGAHWFGTTNVGQDIFAQTVAATRPTLLIGAAAGLIATVVSVVIGIGGGFLGGLADELLALLTNVALVIPTLPLVIVVSKFMGSDGLTPTIFVIALTSWAASARVLRGQTLSLRGRDYVLAAQALDEPRWRIVLVELLPNELPIIVSQFTFSMIFAILSQAGLAFLGLQSADQLTWGNILFFAQNAEALSSGQWWWFAPAGLCIAVFGAGLAMINFGLDELLNPRLRVYRPRRAARGRSGRGNDEHERGAAS